MNKNYLIGALVFAGGIYIGMQVSKKRIQLANKKAIANAEKEAESDLDYQNATGKCY